MTTTETPLNTVAIAARAIDTLNIDPIYDAALEWEIYQALDTLGESECLIIAAFLDLIRDGLQNWRSVEDTAAQFGVKPKVIRQLAAAVVLNHSTHAGNMVFHQRDITKMLELAAPARNNRS